MSRATLSTLVVFNKLRDRPPRELSSVLRGGSFVDPQKTRSEMACQPSILVRVLSKLQLEVVDVGHNAVRSARGRPVDRSNDRPRERVPALRRPTNNDVSRGAPRLRTRSTQRRTQGTRPRRGRSSCPPPASAARWRSQGQRPSRVPPSARAESSIAKARSRTLRLGDSRTLQAQQRSAGLRRASRAFRLAPANHRDREHRRRPRVTFR